MDDNASSNNKCTCGAPINLAHLEGNPEACCPHCQTPLAECIRKQEADLSKMPSPATSARLAVQKMPSGRYALPPRTTCTNHPDKNSHGTCHLCAKPICAICANDFGPFCGPKCKEEFKILLAPEIEPAPAPKPEPPKGFLAGLLNKFRKEK